MIMNKQLNTERAEEVIGLLLYKLLSENIIKQEDINKTIDYIYNENVTQQAKDIAYPI